MRVTERRATVLDGVFGATYPLAITNVYHTKPS